MARPPIYTKELGTDICAPKQAIAVALETAREKGYKIPKK